MSTDLAVGWSADMPARADVIVMEIFDSVLLGEGVLPTMADAAARLLADGSPPPFFRFSFLLILSFFLSFFL